MIPKPRIYISTNVDASLDSNQLSVKRAILSAVEEQGFEPQEFFVSGLALNEVFNFETANKIMARCNGVLVLALAKWEWQDADGNSIKMPSEYCHLEGGMALAHRLPIFVVTDQNVLDRGIVWMGGGLVVNFIPSGASGEWIKNPVFEKRFQAWCESIKNRPRAFLGYCSKAKSTADAITLYLEHSVKVSVRNYAMDFTSGATILEEIERAASECSCGIFLFTNDDPLSGSDAHKAAPRDNVVFEAGFFVRAKGKERALIICEEGVKIPADLGGNIYVSLKDRNDISSIHTALRKFLEDRL